MYKLTITIDDKGIVQADTEGTVDELLILGALRKVEYMVLMTSKDKGQEEIIPIGGPEDVSTGLD